jgi:ornithine cyclodeaminase/alanine dehydrogenase-like protein (mu-crystallin family)
VAPSVDAAVFGAEVVCTTTAAIEPIVERRWLARGGARQRGRIVLPDDP